MQNFAVLAKRVSKDVVIFGTHGIIMNSYFRFFINKKEGGDQ